MPFRILIIGGGLSGLTAAVALSQNGHQVTVLEAASRLTTIGGAIAIPPNSSRVFQQLGLLDEIKSFAEFSGKRNLQFKRYNGEFLCEDSERSRNYGFYQLHIHRARLQELLIAAARAAGSTIHIDSRVARVNDIALHPIAITTDGRQFEADIIIGADGAKSTIRGMKYPDIKLDSNWNVYRAVISGSALLDDPELEPLLKNGTIWWGPGRTVVGVPIQNHTSYSLELAHPGNTGTAGEWNKKGDVNEMKAIFANFEPSIKRLISVVNPKDLLVWKLSQLPELKSWVWNSGRVVLLGDAAHAVLPYSGQGHAMAVEDSFALAVCLSRATDQSEIPRALEAFQKIRKPRTSLVASYSLSNARLWQLPDGAEQQARDAWMRTEGIFAKGKWDGKHIDELPKGGPEDPLFPPWLFGHDVKGFTERRLDEIWKRP